MPQKDYSSDTESKKYQPVTKKFKSDKQTDIIDKNFLREMLVINDFKESLTNVFNNGEIFIRILSDSCDVAFVEDFEYWESDKLNSFKIPIPLNNNEFEIFSETIDNLL